jgi:hypothetical protein
MPEDGDQNSCTEAEGQVLAAMRQFSHKHGIEDGVLQIRDDGAYRWISCHEPAGDWTDLAGILDLIRRWDSLLTSERENGVAVRGARHTNPSDRGGRPPDPAVEKRRRTLIELVDSLRPATVRQVFYAASVRGLVEKSEEGYRKVQNDLTRLRKGGRLSYGWLADSTRWQRKPRTFGSIQQALEDTAKLYRRALWDNADEYVEIWLEKDALAGVIYPVTGKYDVPLMVARGYASLSFLYSAAEFIAELDKPAVIYHLGDYDPSGQDAARAIEQTLRELAPEATIRFKRLAVTPAQIEAWTLPSRPTKKTDTRAAKFGSDTSVELDAIPPDDLRALLEDAINVHLPQDQLGVMLEAEKSERSVLLDIIGGLRTVPPTADKPPGWAS